MVNHPQRSRTNRSAEADLTFQGWGLIGEPQDGVVLADGRIDVAGYNAGDYWQDGEFLGADCYGVTPIYMMADGSQFPSDAVGYSYRA